MLSEEALIVLAAVGAVGLLVLGVLELLWPTRPRHPIRRSAPPPRAARPHRTSALTRHTRERSRAPYARRAPQPSAAAAPPSGVPAIAPPIELPAAPALADSLPAPASAEPAAEVASPTFVVAAPAPSELLAEAAPPLEEAPTPAPVAPITTPPAIEPFASAASESVVETCFSLYQAQRYDELVALADAALGDAVGARRPADAQETAALWSVLALAHQALGAEGDARVALEAAIAVAPAADRSIYERQLASLAESVAQGLLADARRHAAPESEERLAAIRRAVAWLDRGAAAAPGDAGLAELAADAQAMLWPAWERTIMALLQRQDFRAARRLLREAQADPRFPTGRVETFRELFSGTFSGEIGQLTAQAIRSMQEARESDALAALQRAETLLGTLSDAALPPTRREEVDRRLWWGYNKLGARRVDAGQHEEALEPLFHALTYEIGPERRQETVALLARALDGVVDTRALAIRELADAGDREAAVVQCDKLWARLRAATEQGLSQADLGGVLAKVQRLFESLGRLPK